MQSGSRRSSQNCAGPHGSSSMDQIKKYALDYLINRPIKILKLYSDPPARARGGARWSLQLGTAAAGSVTLPPLVLARLPLGWDQRTKSPTEEDHPMPCWPCRATAASMQLVAKAPSAGHESRGLLHAAPPLGVGTHTRTVSRAGTRRTDRITPSRRALAVRLTADDRASR
jgi:hypothetical protein